jgi:hypothetical protein
MAHSQSLKGESGIAEMLSLRMTCSIVETCQGFNLYLIAIKIKKGCRFARHPLIGYYEDWPRRVLSFLHLTL